MPIHPHPELGADLVPPQSVCCTVCSVAAKVISVCSKRQETVSCSCDERQESGERRCSQWQHADSQEHTNSSWELGPSSGGDLLLLRTLGYAFPRGRCEPVFRRGMRCYCLRRSHGLTPSRSGSHCSLHKHWPLTSTRTIRDNENNYTWGPLT